jgi:hypothetical protein
MPAESVEDPDGYVIRSPFRPVTRMARRALQDYEIERELAANETGRNGGVVVAERPPAELLEQHELRLVEAPDEVWSHDNGSRVTIYEAAERVEVDGRDAAMDVAEAKRRCRQEEAFQRSEGDT